MNTMHRRRSVPGHALALVRALGFALPGFAQTQSAEHALRFSEAPPSRFAVSPDNLEPDRVEVLLAGYAGGWSNAWTTVTL
jgi:hypothetical protein